MKWLEHRIPPPAVGLLIAALMWALAGIGPALPMSAPVRLGLALALAALALAFDAAGLWAFYRARTTVNPLRPARAATVVTGGIYRITRNPMYVGMAMLLTAWGIDLGDIAVMVGPVLFVVFITRFQIVPEERALQAKFGEPYARYMGDVRRWL